MVILYFLVGALSGVIGGMGMGGGTALIPALTVFFGVGQQEAQAINLASFIPMAICSLAVHFKNGRIKTKNLLLIIIPACITSLSSSFLANAVGGEILKRIFGGFLILLSVFQFVSALKNRKDKTTCTT